MGAHKISIQTRLRRALVGYVIAFLIIATLQKLGYVSRFSTGGYYPIAWAELFPQLPYIFLFSLIGAAAGFLGGNSHAD